MKLTRFTANDETQCCVSSCRTEVTCPKCICAIKCIWAIKCICVLQWHSPQCPQHSPGVRALVGQVFLTDTSDVCFCWCPMVSLQPDCSLWPYLRSAFWQGVRGDFDLVCTSASYKKHSLLMTSGFQNFFFSFFETAYGFLLHCSWNHPGGLCTAAQLGASGALWPASGPGAPLYALAIAIRSWNRIFPSADSSGMSLTPFLWGLSTAWQPWLCCPRQGKQWPVQQGSGLQHCQPDWVLLLSPWSLELASPLALLL